MKMFDAGLTIFISILLICFIAGAGSIYFLGPDNAVEETAEEVIKKQTGVDVDLSPSTPEKKKTKLA